MKKKRQQQKVEWGKELQKKKKKLAFSGRLVYFLSILFIFPLNEQQNKIMKSQN